MARLCPPRPKVRKYNHIYQLLVQGDDDLIGQVAYTLYKKEKYA